MLCTFRPLHKVFDSIFSQNFVTMCVADTEFDDNVAVVAITVASEITGIVQFQAK